MEDRETPNVVRRVVGEERSACSSALKVDQSEMFRSIVNVGII